MPKKYEIKWVIDDAQARGVFARGVKGMQAIEAAMAKAGTAIEQASAKAAAKMAAVAVTADDKIVKSARKRAKTIEQIEDEQAKRNLRTAVKDAAAREALNDKEVAAAKRKADKIASDKEKAEQEASNKRKRIAVKDAAATEALNDKEIASAKKKADHLARLKESSELGPAGRLAMLKRKVLSDETLEAAAYNRHVDAYHQKRMLQIQKERYGTKTAFIEAIEQATGLGTAMTVVGGTVAALAAIKTVVGGVAAAFGDAKKASEDMAKGALDTLSAMREIASLRDKYAPDKADLAKYAEMRRASGLSKEAAISVSEHLLDTMGAIDPKKLPESEKAKIEISAAKRVSRGGGMKMAEPIAALTGIVADMIPVGPGGTVRAEAVDAMMDQVEEISKKGKSDNATSARTATKVMTTLTSEGLRGQFKDPRKAVALNTIASLFAKDESDTATLEAVRAVSAWSKNRRGKGWVSSQTETLKEAGIEETDEPDVRLTKMFAYAKKNMGPKDSYAGFMGKRGFRNQTENEQLARFYDKWEGGDFGRIMGWTNKDLDEEVSGKKFAAFAASDVGANLLAKAGAEVASDEAGVAGIPMLTGKERASEAMTKGKFFSSPAGSLYAGMVGGLARVLTLGQNQMTGREMVTEQTAMEIAAKEAGLSSRASRGGFGNAAMDWTRATSAGLFGIPGLLYGQVAGNVAGTTASGIGENREEAISLLRQMVKNTDRTKTPEPLPVMNLLGWPFR